ncbi:MAG: protein kinase [Planctomycetota bacterium]
MDKKQEDSFQNHIENCPYCQEQVEKLLKHDTFLKELQAEYNQTYRHDTSSVRDITISNFFLSGLDRTKIDIEFSPGQQLADRYRIIRKLGQKYTNVYHAFDTHLGHEVAIKLVATGPNRSGKAFGQLRQELLFRNPINDFTNVIKTYDIHPAEYEGFSLILLTMEYADGGSLRNWLNESSTNANKRIAEGADLIAQACSAVKIIHNVNLIHRDIKPENILLCRNDDDFIVKLSDFGISYSLADISTDLEQIPIIAGTPLYMAPEQFVFDKQAIIGPASDIYSMGIVIYEILTGKPPFSGNFKQLREKHLHQQPPKLSSDLDEWGLVVERCLKKDPASRYGNINELINDIERLKKGLAINIDISCPQCGHVNLNVNTAECEKCHKRLDSKFRPCPTCDKAVRLDVELCPACRRNVAAYYLLEFRKTQIERLKDQDPVKTIEILEMVLQSNAEDYKQQAIELVKELRQKQNQIKGLTDKAHQQISEGLCEQAIETWRDVLKLTSHHWLALEQIPKIESILKDIKRKQEEASDLIEQAEFLKAEMILTKCLEILPSRKNTKELIETCRARSSKYAHDFENAVISANKKILLKANEYITEALIHAPESPEAKSLRKKLSSEIEKAEKLVWQARQQLLRAEFAEAAQTIENVRQIQIDNQNTVNLEKELARIIADYDNLLKKALTAKDSGDLDLTVEQLEKSLGLCPESSQAKSLLQQVKQDQAKTRSLAKDVVSAIQAARFDDAHTIIKQIEKLWPVLKELQSARDNLTRTQSEYSRSIGLANNFIEKKELVSALSAAESASKICPMSAEAKSLINKITADQARAKELTDEANRAISAAVFEKADILFKRIAEISPTFPGLEQLISRFEKTRIEYDIQIKNARKTLGEKNLAAAMASANSALRACSDSTEASELAAAIQQICNNAKKDLSGAQKCLKAADFDKAKAQLEQAKQKWPTMEGLNGVQKAIESSIAPFKTAMHTANKNFAQNNFKDALTACKKALALCPNAPVAKRLAEQIREKIESEEEKRRKTEKFNRFAFFGIAIAVLAGPVTIGVLFSWRWLNISGASLVISNWHLLVTIYVVLAVTQSYIHKKRRTIVWRNTNLLMLFVAPLLAGGALIFSSLFIVSFGLRAPASVGIAIGLLAGVIIGIILLVRSFLID